MITITRYHDISCGHRVHGHESKCAHLHGHNYRIHFTCCAENLDQIGRVIDFGVVKERLCMYLEEYWDHKMLIWEDDPMLVDLLRIDLDGIRRCKFNPTAENMAKHLVEEIGPMRLEGTGVTLVRVTIEETAKCSATYELSE